MTADDLARQVAKDMSQEVGVDISEPTEAKLRGESTRGWGDAVAIGSFLIEVCGFAWSIYKDTQSQPELRKRLEEMITRPANVTEANANLVIDNVVERLTEKKA